MAEAFLQIVLENLNSLIRSELGFLSGVDKDMIKLSSTFSAIQAVLEDAEQRQLKDKAVHDWLQKLKYAVYEVDDILDDCRTEVLRSEYEGQSSGSLQKVRTSLLNPVKKILFRYKIGNRIKEITESIDAIANERSKFHLREGLMEEKRVEYVESRETSSFSTQPELFGRDEDREKIVKFLVENVCDSDDVTVYPIVGIGGLGKTTLAQMAFNDERVKCHFEPKIWVYVSQDFDVKRVIKTIIESISGETCISSDLDSLQKKLQDVLNGKRYLIVLDDVWDENQDKWDRMKYGLACGSKGMSIIVTTRLEKVASIMGTLPVPHYLSFLSEDDCWLLFKQRAFRQGSEEHPNLVAIGKQIVKKCGGVPLAAKALGGLMRFKSEENEWLFVKESEIWNLAEDENSILPALRLSYYNLPWELRRCFAYCAIFPKGFKIEKGNLIRLWMANGYISCKRKLELEDIGDQIWNELCCRSFFQDVDKDETGRLTWFKMHDLVHDLSQSVMEDECHKMEIQNSSNIPNNKVCHFTLVADFVPVNVFPDTLQIVGSLRTFRIQHQSNLRTLLFQDDTLEFSCDFRKFGSLRVFDARYTGMKMIPSSIGNLKHLRYLDLSIAGIEQLPNSICSLWNLQTLILDSCWKLKRLPKNMKYLRSLRHLYLPLNALIDMPPKIGQLTCLKTLSLFVVGKSTGCQLAELQCLDLGGELRIEHLERLRNAMDAKEANLVGKKNLRWLELSWGYNLAEFESQENVMDAKEANLVGQPNIRWSELLEALEPHPNLKGLVIENYRGTHFPLWMTDLMLRNIVVINLFNCKNCVQLPPFGKLPLLQRLTIYGMDKVEYIDNGFTDGGLVKGFPSLEVLYLSVLPNLKGLSREEGRELLPRLRKLSISGCPKLSLPNLTREDGRELLGCLREMDVSNCPKFSFPPLPSLKKLKIFSNCTNMVVNSISNLNGLTFLEVADNEEAISFPEEVLGNLTLLESLTVKRFTKIKTLPKDLSSLVALRTLNISVCPELESLPERGLQGLESLQLLNITHCNKLSSLSDGLRHLTSLEELVINGCPELVALPECIKHLISLRRLTISGSPWAWDPKDPVLEAKLVALPVALQLVPGLQYLMISSYQELTLLPDWLGNLTSLQSLDICFCPKIVSLPASIQSLTKLQSLLISGCASELARRCEKGKGEDWYKIAHIPQVSVYPFVMPKASMFRHAGCKLAPGLVDELATSLHKDLSRN